MFHRVLSFLVPLSLSLVTLGCEGTIDPPPQAQPGQVYELLGEQFTVLTAARSLKVPWAVTWTPGGWIIITERGGRLSTIDAEDKTLIDFADVPAVAASGEHGLMSVALSPQFDTDRFIYLSYTTHGADGKLKNVITRFHLDGKLTAPKVLVDNLPASDYHDGLPLRFGPDGMLYASTGDATQRDLAQKTESLAGKFLRMDKDGNVPADNPMPNSLIWSLGHRNCQGFDWHPVTGQLYATEHGPSRGVEPWSGGDELNLIRKGGNYGWPLHHHGDGGESDFVAPLKYWGEPAIAPAGAAFYTGDKFPRWKNRLFFANLRGQSLMCVTFDEKDPSKIVDLQETLKNQFGRLRAVATGPDGSLYITTSNRDGRGSPAADDDRLLRLVPVRK